MPATTAPPDVSMEYQVFIGAPSVSDLDKELTGLWVSVSAPLAQVHSRTPSQPGHVSIEEVSERLSRLYEGIIFGDEDEDTSMDVSDDTHHSGLDTTEDTEMISWPPTNPISEVASKLILNTTIASGLGEETFETQDTSVDNSADDSMANLNFPNFRINLHTLTPISSIVNSRSFSKRLCVLSAVLEVDGPDVVRLKKGPDAGREVSLLKMILGDDSGSVIKAVAWRETAEAWAEMGLRKGDVVVIDSLLVNYIPSAVPSLTASPKLHSKLEICYRTLVLEKADRKLCPDLRLGNVDPGIARVAAVVRWVEGMIGLTS